VGDLAVEYADDWESVLPKAEAVVVVTAWPEYWRLTAPHNLQSLRDKCVFDSPPHVPTDRLFPRSKYLTIGREM